MKEIRRKLGTINIGNYFDKILWLHIIPYTTDSIKYKIYCCVPELPDNFDISKVPKISNGKDGCEIQAWYISGGSRYKSYHKVYLNMYSIEELQVIVGELIKNPVLDIFTFNITIDVENIINELKISVL